MRSRGRLRLRLRSRKSKIMFHEKNRLVFVLETQTWKFKLAKWLPKRNELRLPKWLWRRLQIRLRGVLGCRAWYLASASKWVRWAQSCSQVQVLFHPVLLFLKLLRTLVECDFCVSLATKDLMKCPPTFINLAAGFLSSALLLWNSRELARHPHLWTAAAAEKTKPYVSFSAFYCRYSQRFKIFTVNFL